MNDRRSHGHKMTLFNFDLYVKWRYEGDVINITDVTIPIYWGNNLIDLMSERALQAIVDDIKQSQEWDGRGAS